MYEREELSKVKRDVCECIDNYVARAQAHLSATAHNARSHFNSLLKIEQGGLLSKEVHEQGNNDVSITISRFAHGTQESWKLIKKSKTIGCKIRH